jgi:adenylate cyclase class 2
MQNIEIKAHYENSNRAHEIAKKLEAKFQGQETQIDTYFKVPNGRFKLRESSIHGGQLVPYLRPNATGPKKSQYQVLPVAKSSELKSILEAILGIDVVVTKKRSVYILDNVRIHIDEVENLGNFFEFEAVFEDLANEEAEKNKVSALIKKFEIKDSDLLKFSYRELLEQRNEKEK